jgi:hypothetical protein
MTKASERRDGPRIDLRLRVRYEAGETTGEAEASDVSPRGLRLESDKPVPAGTALKMHVDAGEAEELEANGYITWCRPRASPTGKQLYDLGVSFESDWLAKDRGPLGSALARIFAMNSYEPARNFERTPVALQAASASPSMQLEVTDISIGGMRLKSKSGPLSEHVKGRLAVKIVVDISTGSHTIPGRVAWVAGSAHSFGIELAETSQDDKALLERIRTGQTEPLRITITLES